MYKCATDWDEQHIVGYWDVTPRGPGGRAPGKPRVHAGGRRSEWILGLSVLKARVQGLYYVTNYVLAPLRTKYYYLLRFITNLSTHIVAKKVVQGNVSSERGLAACVCLALPLFR